MIDIHLNLGNHNVLLETNYDLWVFITGPLPTFKWTYRIAHNRDRVRAWTIILVGPFFMCLMLESVTPYTQRKIKFFFVTNSTKDPSNSMKPIRDYVFTSDYLREAVDTSLRRCKSRTPSTGIHTHELQSVLAPFWELSQKSISLFFTLCSKEGTTLFLLREKINTTRVCLIW